MNTISKTTDLFFKYVPHRLVPSYLKAGWIETDILKGTGHAFYSCMMKWPDENSEPVEPQS